MDFFNFLICICFITVSSIDRPVIGILTQPTNPFFSHHQNFNQYIPASYVQWVHSSGGKVVPIFYDDSFSDIFDLFGKINGVILPGGIEQYFNMTMNVTQFIETAKYIFDISLEANKDGDYFPIWGTCQGFQQLLVFVADDLNAVHCSFDSNEVMMNLLFTNESSKIFEDFPNEKEMFSKYNFTLNWHDCGITRGEFRSNAKLSSFFKEISFNYDEQGKDFVSVVEGKEYPYYGVQFHPEQIIFDDLPYFANHTYESVKSNAALGLFFVNEARKSTHTFETVYEEQRYLIYNYDVTFTGKVSPIVNDFSLNDYSLTYFFKPSPPANWWMWWWIVAPVCLVLFIGIILFLVFNFVSVAVVKKYCFKKKKKSAYEEL